MIISSVSPDGRWLYATSEVAVPPGGSGTLLVTNFSSGQLEAVDIASLPSG